MFGLMQDRPLLIQQLIEHAALNHGESPAAAIEPLLAQHPLAAAAGGPLIFGVDTSVWADLAVVAAFAVAALALGAATLRRRTA